MLDVPLGKKRRHWPASVGAAVVAALLLATGPAIAQETREMQVHFGELTYRLFCVGCHGAGGRGDGEVAAALDMPVGDLTLIARSNSGVFPAQQVLDAITGSGQSGHRALAMESWSEMFADEFERFAQEVVADAMVARRIDHLIAYLESIQR